MRGKATHTPRVVVAEGGSEGGCNPHVCSAGGLGKCLKTEVSSALWEL